MKYVGIQTQIARNNLFSIILLVAFPFIVLLLTQLFFYVLHYMEFSNSGATDTGPYIDAAHASFLAVAPWVVVGVGVWFAFSYFSHTRLINSAAGSHTLDRQSNMRVYNLVENLCMLKGMKMPKIHIIESDALNAFASGLNDNTYTVTLTQGIIETLNDEELEAVIAHELCHIRNKDVRLLIVSIIFVGLFSFITYLIFRLFLSGRIRSRKGGKGAAGVYLMMLVALVLAGIGYLATIMFRFSLSRKREYMADAGAAEMTKKPWALASALDKISGHATIPEVSNGDVAQLFISNEQKGFFAKLSSMFATHPPIEKRIALLNQMG